MSRCMCMRARPFKRSSTIVVLLYVFNLRNAEMDRSHSHEVTGMVPRIRSAILMFAKPSKVNNFRGGSRQIIYLRQKRCPPDGRGEVGVARWAWSGGRDHILYLKMYRLFRPMSGLFSMPRNCKPQGEIAVPTWTASYWKAEKEQSGFKAPDTRLSHLCQKARGVWLEKGTTWGISWMWSCSILHTTPVFLILPPPLQNTKIQANYLKSMWFKDNKTTYYYIIYFLYIYLKIFILYLIHNYLCRQKG